MYDIFTDTSANLPWDEFEESELKIISFHYIIDGKAYSETDSLPDRFDGKKFYAQMRNGTVVTTSMINSAAFCEAFEESLAAGRDVIYVGMSSGISGAYSASVVAAQEMREKYPERKIAVIDTRAASLGEGIPVKYALGLKKSGATFEETVEKTWQNASAICQYFTVEDLMYLKRGGRISCAAAIVGNLLHIKPVLQGDNEGKIVLYRKVRGKKAALGLLAQKYAELVADKSLPVGIAHADSIGDAEALAEMLKQAGHCGELINVCYEPVTGSHVGPGTVALFFYGVHR